MGGPITSCLEQVIKNTVGKHGILVLDASEGPLTLDVRYMIHEMNKFLMTMQNNCTLDGSWYETMLCHHWNNKEAQCKIGVQIDQGHGN
jgi:hypothetical protein